MCAPGRYRLAPDILKTNTRQSHCSGMRFYFPERPQTEQRGRRRQQAGKEKQTVGQNRNGKDKLPQLRELQRSCPKQYD